jgi:hypothetical protein
MAIAEEYSGACYLSGYDVKMEMDARVGSPDAKFNATVVAARIRMGKPSEVEDAGVGGAR